MSVLPSVQNIIPSSAHDGLRSHLLLQLCSTLNVPVAQIGWKCGQSDERRVLITSRCAALSAAILNLTYSSNIVAD
jgi:hypothetical protein